ncbi:transposase [Streptomyces sp. NPDC048438]|uniref:transposase n=1 Tax=Streptomyces sp. NPDC048438 TaxID=3365551 RepID=UPI0037231370
MPQLKDAGPAAAAGDYRLVTTLLDPRRYPARQLAAFYRERWKIECVCAELKTHQRGAKVVLGSKTPAASSNRSGPISWSTTHCASSW